MFDHFHARCLSIGLAIATSFSIAGVTDTVSAVELIVHAGVHDTHISRNQARAIFSARLSHWEDGKAIRVFVLPEETAIHHEFAKRLLDLYPYQLRDAWVRVISTGMGQAPIMVADESEMRRLVADTPGAIGYVGKVQGDDKIRALPIR